MCYIVVCLFGCYLVCVRHLVFMRVVCLSLFVGVCVLVVALCCVRLFVNCLRCCVVWFCVDVFMRLFAVDMFPFFVC